MSVLRFPDTKQKKKQSCVYEALTERSNNYERYRMLTLYLLLSLCVHLRKENL